MHLEIEINKEILDQDTQVVSGLSARRLISLIVAAIFTIIINFTIAPMTPQLVDMLLYVLAVLPCFMIGFVTYNGLTGEKVVAMVVRYMLAKKRLKHVETNYYVNA